MAEYVFHGSAEDYVRKFRMSSKAFNDLVTLIESRRVPDECGRALIGLPGAVPTRVADLIPTRFKVGCCVYMLAHGPEIPVLADVCSVEPTTVRSWLVHF